MNRIVECWLRNKSDFPGWTALGWLKFVLEDEHDFEARSWSQDEIWEATDMFMHPVFGGN